jgi:hypothetical protein
MLSGAVFVLCFLLLCQSSIAEVKTVSESPKEVVEILTHLPHGLALPPDDVRHLISDVESHPERYADSVAAALEIPDGTPAVSSDEDFRRLAQALGLCELLGSDHCTALVRVFFDRTSTLLARQNWTHDSSVFPPPEVRYPQMLRGLSLGTLGRLGDTYAVGKVLGTLESENLSGRAVIYQYLNAVGKLDPRVPEFLREITRDPQSPLYLDPHALRVLENLEHEDPPAGLEATGAAGAPVKKPGPTLRDDINAFLSYGPGAADHLGPDFDEKLLTRLTGPDTGDAIEYLSGQIRPASEFLSLGPDARGRQQAVVYLYIRCCGPGKEYGKRMLDEILELYPVSLPRRFNKKEPEDRDLRMAIVPLRQSIFAAFGESGDDRVLSEAFRIMKEADDILQRGVLDFYLTPLLKANTDALKRVRKEVADSSSSLYDDPRLVRFIHGIEQEQ